MIQKWYHHVMTTAIAHPNLALTMFGRKIEYPVLQINDETCKEKEYTYKSKEST